MSRRSLYIDKYLRSWYIVYGDYQAVIDTRTKLPHLWERMTEKEIRQNLDKNTRKIGYWNESD